MRRINVEPREELASYGEDPGWSELSSDEKWLADLHRYMLEGAIDSWEQAVVQIAEERVFEERRVLDQLVAQSPQHRAERPPATVALAFARDVFYQPQHRA